MSAKLPILKKTLHGPGIRVEIDSEEVYPSDPGAGTPALVCAGRGRDEHTASFCCAVNEGELDCGEFELSNAQLKWLRSIEGHVDNLLRPYWAQ